MATACSSRLSTVDPVHEVVDPGDSRVECGVVDQAGHLVHRLLDESLPFHDLMAARAFQEGDLQPLRMGERDLRHVRAKPIQYTASSGPQSQRFLKVANGPV